MFIARHDSTDQERSRLTVTLPSIRSQRLTAIAARAAAAVLLVLIGIFHLIEAPGHFAQQPYVGVLF